MNIKFIRILFAFMVLSLSHVCYSDIVKTSDYQVLENLLLKADSTTLVLFDIDDVLIAPSDLYYLKDPIRKKFLKEFQGKYSKSEFNDIFTSFFLKREVMLVEPRFIAMLNDLQARGVPTAALTAWWTGKFGSYPNIEDLRFKGLDDVGISFATSSPFGRDIVFPELNAGDGAPMVKLGVIFTALVDKGKVLESVFEAESLQFSHLVFIDDDRSNLDSVEEFCLKNDIEFRGVHYRASENIKRPALSEDKERLRFKILEEQKIWLDDTELESYIAKTYDLQ